MGALFGMKIDRCDDLTDAISCLRATGRRVFAAALDRDSVKSYNKDKKYEYKYDTKYRNRKMYIF